MSRAAHTEPEDAARWRTVCERRKDPSFVYAVSTTGVYCHSGCSARRPRRENVEFFASPIAAELAGYRACKKCKPSPSASSEDIPLVVAMCTFLETTRETPTLERLAQHVGLSPARTKNLFSATTGLSPRAYHEALLRRRVHTHLAEGQSVGRAIYAAGFASSSRFYDRVGEMLGMTPREFQRRAAGLTIRFAVTKTALGHLLVGATSTGICALFLGDDAEELTHDLEDRFAEAELIGGDSTFDRMVQSVVSLVEGKRPSASRKLPLDLRGTAFQQQVWQALLDIPLGTTTTYAELARAIGKPQATRAVANACGKNPVSVLVPCHRVIRTDGGLGGYRWGIERKEKLLRRERDTSRR